MQKLKFSPADEQLLMTQVWSRQIADDPESFVMFMFPWGKKNTPLEHHAGPRRWQRKVLREMRDHIASNNEVTSAELFQVLRDATVSGRGVGKSALVSWLILWMLTTRIGSSVIVSANTENQLRTVTWGELTKWVAMSLNSHWWEPSATKLVPASWLTELVERDLKKGTRYWGAEGKLWSEENPDGYAGAHNYDGMMVIFDEASGIPDSIWGVAEGFFTELIRDRYWFAFSNGRRNTGRFFECFHLMRNFWKHRQIDARTVEGTDKKVYGQIIESHGEDSYEARVEVYGEFPTEGDDQFISPLLVDDAMRRPRWNDTTAPIIIGVDPARGGDQTVIVVRQGRDILDIKRHADADTMIVVGKVIEAIEEWNPDLTVIDEGGLGYGVLDRLKEQNYKVRGVNFGWKSKNPRVWLNKRSEMWGSMKEWLKTASIREDKRLKSDLTAPKRETDSSGAMQLESKKKMRARGLPSTDSGDALAVTFAFSVSKRRSEYTPTHQTPTSRRSGGGGGISSNWMGN